MFRQNRSGKFDDEPRLDDVSAEEAPGYQQQFGAHNVDTSDNGLIDPDSGVKRGLKDRHLSMMALAGIIGPGLLVGSGGALNSGGPASLIIGFGVIGMPLNIRFELFMANFFQASLLSPSCNLWVKSPLYTQVAAPLSPWLSAWSTSPSP